jgi:hypothetical protein
MKHQWDCATRKLHINKNLFTFFPCQKFTLELRSETIIAAVTKNNITDVVHAVKTKPEVIIEIV